MGRVKGKHCSRCEGKVRGLTRGLEGRIKEMVCGEKVKRKRG